jgi:hypothetical protein
MRTNNPPVIQWHVDEKLNPDYSRRLLGDLLTGAALDQDQVIAVTGPDRAVHLADLGIEHHLIEFLHHLSRGDHAEIAAQAPGGTLGMGSGAFGEVFAPLDAGFQLFAGFFVGHQDMQNVGHGHGVLL